ncbi:MAG: diguanylate cyclase [Desulfobulbaceae bacterium]|nr:MAG: diguanylate cyclase [Desulfobulbaceae bacterium]
MKIKENILIISMIWIGLIALSFWWNYTNAMAGVEQSARQGARSFFQQLVLTREWNARHGGLYAPVSRETRPNPYLQAADRDVVGSDGRTFTMINPAYMTRQLSELAQERAHVRFHITSLKPIRPENAPTGREEKALQAFARGRDEVGYFIRNNGRDTYFYMAPLVTGKACLACHGQQGYQEGDIRGGISISLPFTTRIPLTALIMGHLAIALCGLTGIFYAGRRLHHAYETTRQQAVIDALTGIPNRRSFTESLLREFDRCRRTREPLSIIICDIDKFKDYNDIYGHIKGDICLKMVAQTIEKSLARPGDFCGRYGGEEFVVILSDTPLTGAVHVAERIRQAIVDLAIYHETSPPLQRVTISLGVATSADPRRISHDDLVRFADQALYAAKDKGRNRVETYGQME